MFCGMFVNCVGVLCFCVFVVGGVLMMFVDVCVWMFFVCVFVGFFVFLCFYIFLCGCGGVK